MAIYAIWNNKGGVGKSYLTFQLASEYARQNREKRVLVVSVVVSVVVLREISVRASRSLRTSFETCTLLLVAELLVVTGCAGVLFRAPISFTMISPWLEWVLLSPKNFHR